MDCEEIDTSEHGTPVSSGKQVRIKSWNFKVCPISAAALLLYFIYLKTIINQISYSIQTSNGQLTKPLESNMLLAQNFQQKIVILLRWKLKPSEEA